jgi:hypothetical protein
MPIARCGWMLHPGLLLSRKTRRVVSETGMGVPMGEIRTCGVASTTCAVGSNVILLAQFKARLQSSERRYIKHKQELGHDDYSTSSCHLWPQPQHTKKSCIFDYKKHTTCQFHKAPQKAGVSHSHSHHHIYTLVHAPPAPAPHPTTIRPPTRSRLDCAWK